MFLQAVALYFNGVFKNSATQFLSATENARNLNK
jgi:hypothetical protein